MAESFYMPTEAVADMFGYRTLSAFYAARREGRLKLKPSTHARGVWDRADVTAEYRRLRGDEAKKEIGKTLKDRLDLLDG